MKCPLCHCERERLYTCDECDKECCICCSESGSNTVGFTEDVTKCHPCIAAADHEPVVPNPRPGVCPCYQCQVANRPEDFIPEPDRFDDAGDAGLAGLFGTLDRFHGLHDTSRNPDHCAAIAEATPAQLAQLLKIGDDDAD